MSLREQLMYIDDILFAELKHNLRQQLAVFYYERGIVWKLDYRSI
jgi:hypothetical protein